METELVCPLCGQQYENNNLPRLLTLCGHTFCEECIMKTIETDDHQNILIKCPQDQKTIALKEKSLVLFPKNIALIKMLENKRNSSVFKPQDVSFDVSKITGVEQFAQEDFTKEFFADNIQQNIIDASNCQTYCKYQECSTLEANQVSEFSKITESRSEKQHQICLLHQKSLDIVCINCLEKICTNCAIFGAHKGHDCKSIEDIQKEQSQYVNQILSIINKKQSLEKVITNQKNEAEILQILSKKSDNLNKKIKNHYSDLKRSIQQAEQKSLNRMKQKIEKTELQLKKLLKLSPNIAQKYSNWQEQSLEILEALGSHQYEESLAVLLDDKMKGKSFLNRGNQIVQEIVFQQKQLVVQVQKILDRIGFSHSNKLLQLLDSFIQPYEKQEKLQGSQLISNEKCLQVKPKNSTPGYKNQCEDSLLEDISCADASAQISFSKQFTKNSHASIECVINIQSSQNNTSFTKNVKQQTDKQTSMKSTPKAKTKTRTVSRAQSFATSVNQSFMEIQKTIKGDQKQGQRPKRKKTVKIVVPQKYEIILQGIKNNTLETVDFTNAELGDAVIMGIAQLITPTKARTVKLIRNKLTDDSISKIMIALSSVNSLNLSQNNLTQKTLDLLIQFFEKEPTNIKSVILSQNKIIERKHKAKLEKLRKMNITVSV